MYCPVCRYEFRCGFTKCNECGVDLVGTLPPEDGQTEAGAATETMVSPRLLWRGYDNSSFNDIRMALDSASIPYNREELDARMLYTDAYSPLEVWVPEARLPEAQNMVDEVLSSCQQAATPNSQSRGDVFELPAEDDEADDVHSGIILRELDPEDATAEIWSGADATTSVMLKSCLTEIGIACYVDRPESGNFAVRVLPEDEKRAGCIVRQVVEGILPE